MKPLYSLVCLAALFLCGCSSVEHRRVSNGQATEKILKADGYSRFGDVGQYKLNQRWLSAQQMAKLNAYRGLADQLYYEPLGQNKTVGSQVMQHEVYRVYLDTYLREARATDYQTLQENLKTTLQLKLTPRFYRCMTDISMASQCLREDNKSSFTRLGYKTASTGVVNMACGMPDCSDQLSVSGFSRERNGVDDALLGLGFYDVEWTLNTGARTFFNYLLINGFMNAL